MNRFTPNLETLDERINLSASPMPVLLVIADQRDFHTEPARVSTPTGGMNTALGDGSVRFLKDTIDVRTSLSSGETQTREGAIVFVGGWGSSMYQY